MNVFSLEERRALITGGSRGIGLGIARRFAEAGADVILIARQKSGLEDARQLIEGMGRQVGIYAFDLSKVDRIQGVFDTIVAQEGPVDLLVNAAGMSQRGAAQAISLEEWSKVMTLNVTSVFALSQAFAHQRILLGEPGKIINIASLMSEGVRPTTAAYATSKGGIRQLTKALAVDWAGHGIHVNAIGPGYIKTPMTRPLYEDPKFDAWVKRRTPLGRWGMPDDIATAAVFLASEAADFITGQVLYVDGGWLSTF